MQTSAPRSVFGQLEMSFSIKKLETELNVCFTNKEILKESMTHRSYKFENHEDLPDNQRLEFLGDAVLELITSRYLFERYPNSPEGDLTKYRAALVQESALYECAKKINLGNHLLLGKSEIKSAGAKRPSNLSDAYEALIAAIYIDQGYESARLFHIKIIDSLWSEPAELIRERNPKGTLQEMTQKIMVQSPSM